MFSIVLAFLRLNLIMLNPHVQIDPWIWYWWYVQISPWNIPTISPYLAKKTYIPAVGISSPSTQQSILVKASRVSYCWPSITPSHLDRCLKTATDLGGWFQLEIYGMKFPWYFSHFQSQNMDFIWGYLSIYIYTILYMYIYMISIYIYMISLFFTCWVVQGRLVACCRSSLWTDPVRLETNLLDQWVN